MNNIIVVNQHAPNGASFVPPEVIAEALGFVIGKIFGK